MKNWSHWYFSEVHILKTELNYCSRNLTQQLNVDDSRGSDIIENFLTRVSQNNVTN